MSAATKDFLALLHSDLAKALSEKITSGEATAADMAVARQFLKDNGIEAVAAKRSPLEALKHAADGSPATLPDFEEDPEDALIH